MRVFAKLFTAVRGGVREAAEVVVDANALRIFEQEIYECESALQQAKKDLSRVMAEKLRLQREMKTLRSAVEEKEALAVRAVQANDEPLARELAGLIADKERVFNEHGKRVAQLEAHEARLLKTLRAVVRKVQDYRHELRLAKATASSQRAFRALAADTDILGGRFADMQDSLARIRQTQEDFADRFEAMEQVERSLSGQALDDRVREISQATESDPAESVLKRIRERATKG